MTRKQDSSQELLPPAGKEPESIGTALVVGRITPLANLDINALLNKAIDAKSAVEVMERLQAMRKELREEEAKAAFDESMSAFQAECPVIAKEKGVPDRSGKIAYKYAPIEAIEVQIRPLLRKHGFSHTFDTDTASADGWVIAKCIVTHTAGHSRVSTAKFPLGTKTGIMSDTQVFAAALTFANRRALSNAYGLILGGEDLDGQGKLKPAGPSSIQGDDARLRPFVEELWKLLTPVAPCPPNVKNWDSRNAWLWQNEILNGASDPPEAAPHLTAERFQEVIAKVKEEIR